MRTLTGNIFCDSGHFKYGEVSIDCGKITDIRIMGEAADHTGENMIIPGLVDIHTHGCMGHDTCDSDPDGIVEMAGYELSRGVTSYFPTTMTLSKERITAALSNVKEAAKKAKNIKGVYLEGPFISKEKCGAQDPQFVIAPDAKLLESFNEASGGLIRFVAVAPESSGACEIIEKLHDKYAFSLAHSTADYDTAVKAFNAGAAHVTHFYNAMPPYTHRAPGIIGAAMDRDDAVVELICDGIHVHPAVVRNTFKYFGGRRVCLISDSMEAAGMPDGKYSLGGQDVFVKARHAVLKDGTLAGSASTLHDCLKEVIKMGVDPEEAVMAATHTPAKEAGLFEHTGSITVGKAAELVVMDKDYDILEVIN